MKPWLGILFALCAHAAAAKDYLVVATRPNRLHVIDAAARQVVGSFAIPGDGIPSTVTVPADGKVAYVLTNRNESVSGIDLDSGKQVFRTDMSAPGVRVKSMMAVAVSEDGAELYVYQLPTLLKRNEYEVQDARIAVYRTADGIGAKPVRTFPAPRRIALLAVGHERHRVVALGWDVYVFDTEAGKIVDTLPLRNWKRPGIGEPDVLDFWPSYEQTGVLSTPYFAPRTDVDPQSSAALALGVLTLDLNSGAFAPVEVANAEEGVFSSVVNPAKRSEAFGVMNHLYKFDLAGGKVAGRANLDRTYYAINISSDGKEVYVGGATDVITVFDAETLERKGAISLPDGSDQGTSSLRVVRR